jgi:hypothetical protein
MSLHYFGSEQTVPESVIGPCTRTPCHISPEICEKGQEVGINLPQEMTFAVMVLGDPLDMQEHITLKRICFRIICTRRKLDHALIVWQSQKVLSLQHCWKHQCPFRSLIAIECVTHGIRGLHATLFPCVNQLIFLFDSSDLVHIRALVTLVSRSMFEDGHMNNLKRKALHISPFRQ